jgi:hypothetical protein
MTDETTEGSFDVFDARGVPLILDSDVARLFGIETKQLNQQLRRNTAKFDGFAFQLTPEEAESLRSQNVTSNAGRGGRRHRPYSFTEQKTLARSANCWPKPRRSRQRLPCAPPRTSIGSWRCWPSSCG